MRTKLPVRIAVCLSFCLATILLSGCLREKRAPLTWADFLGAVTNLDHVARLDVPSSTLTSSADPSGGNEDYNQFVRKGPRGWVVIADLKGPGVVTRLWLTGVSDGSQRVRFHVDGSWRPTLELTLNELAGGREPFVAPLAAYENGAWYSLVPMPYRKRLVILVEDTRGRDSGWARLSWQVNHTALPREVRLQSFTGVVTERDRLALKELAQAWRSFDRLENSSGMRIAVGSLALQPGESRWMDPIRGPGIIRRLTIMPKYARMPSAMDRQNLLRDVLLKIKWDKSTAPSVVAPVGDFFGSMWNPLRFRSAFFGLTNNTWLCSFPMPFSAEAEITLENQGINTVELEIEVLWEPVPARHASAGYFHAAWSGSLPEDAGTPHTVLDVKGRGKFVGCVIGTCSRDRDWRVQEGDEYMLVDGGAGPGWRGTALDHYFGMGRTFQGPITRPFHGTVFRTFFGTVQYRLHATDAVRFDNSFRFLVERGPLNESGAWMQSVAFYYMSEPTPASPAEKTAALRPFPVNPVAEAAIMSELLNFERMGDFQGAREHIARYLDRFPASRYGPVLRLRQIAYVEVVSGFDAAWPLYQQFITDETDEIALAQARLLAWFLENPENALVCLYSSGRGVVLLNGTAVCTVDGPDRISVVGVKVKPGRHCMAVQAVGQPQPNWVQACLKMRRSTVSTQAGWKYAFDDGGNWGVPGYDDNHWKTIDRTGTMAPPEEPFIWIEPNAFVGLQAVGLRPGDREWPDRQSTVTFRKEFDVR